MFMTPELDAISKHKNTVRVCKDPAEIPKLPIAFCILGDSIQKVLDVYTEVEQFIHNEKALQNSIRYWLRTHVSTPRKLQLQQMQLTHDRHLQNIENTIVDNYYNFAKIADVIGPDLSTNICPQLNRHSDIRNTISTHKQYLTAIQKYTPILTAKHRSLTSVMISWRNPFRWDSYKASIYKSQQEVQKKPDKIINHLAAILETLQQVKVTLESRQAQLNIGPNDRTTL